MKKSSLVAGSLAAVVAALLAGCSNDTETADCVDSTGRVISDSYCDGSASTGYYGYHNAHWVYGGSYHSSGGYGIVTGGSTSPSEDASAVSRSGESISHGGFGGGGDAHGGGGSGE